MIDDGPEVFRCAADPDVETALRCGSCDTPICPRCLIMTPVGARCRSCARLRTHPVYDVRPMHYLRAAGAGLGVALLGGFVVPFIPFFNVFALLILGAMTGEAVSRAANRKQGRGLMAVAAITTALGVLGAQVLLAAGALPSGVPLGLRLTMGVTVAANSLFSIWGLFLLLAVVIAASRVR